MKSAIVTLKVQLFKGKPQNMNPVHFAILHKLHILYIFSRLHPFNMLQKLHVTGADPESFVREGPNLMLLFLLLLFFLFCFLWG